MALTKAKIREILSDAGVETDRITEAANRIYDGYSAALDLAHDENAKLREKVAGFDDIRRELEELKKSSKQEDYDKLKQEYDQYKADVEKKEAQAAKEKAYRAALKDANLNEKGIEKAVKYADWNGIELDDDGNLKDAKKHIKEVREEWAEYVTTQGQKGADTPKPPTGGGGAKLSREDIYKTDDKGRFVMDTQARQKALAKLIEDEAD